MPGGDEESAKCDFRGRVAQIQWDTMPAPGLESRDSVWVNVGGFEASIGTIRLFSHGAGSFQGPGMEA